MSANNRQLVPLVTEGFTDRDVPDQTGRTILVTGANSGIGFATSAVLSRAGARVLLACRDHDKATAAAARIRELTPDADLGIVVLVRPALPASRPPPRRSATRRQGSMCSSTTPG